jgi:hypothetical protein
MDWKKIDDLINMLDHSTCSSNQSEQDRDERKKSKSDTVTTVVDNSNRLSISRDSDAVVF